MNDACDLPALQKVCQTAGQNTVQLVVAPFDALAQLLAQAAAWLFTQMWSVLDSTTLVDLTRPGYVGVYDLIFGLAVVLMLIFFCLQLLTGLIHRDPAALSRAAVGLGKSVLGSFLVITLTATLLEITDKLSVGIVRATGQTMAGMGDRLASLTDTLSGFVSSEPATGAILTIILASLAVAAVLVVWFSLLIRKALLLVAVVFAPVALAGFSWDATRGWFGRWASFVIALSCSKLVLVVVFLLAVNQTDAPIDQGLQSVSEPIAGIALMLVAAFAPFLGYKFISFIGFDIGHAVATEQEAKAAVAHPMPVSIGAPLAGRARAILGRSGGSSGTTAGAEGVPAGSAAQASTRAATNTAPATTGAEATAVGGPIGAGVMAVATIADAGPRVGKQLAQATSDHVDHATADQQQPAQDQPGPAGAPPPNPSSRNPWLTPGSRPPVNDPAPPEPAPPTRPPTGSRTDD